MITETMTVHEALCELKVLDKRIIKKIQSSSYCTTNRHSNTRIDGKTIAEYKEMLASDLQSIKDLIARRYAIRNALAQSNAQTVITVGGKEYTIATAIEMKRTGIGFTSKLLDYISYSYRDAKETVTRENGEALNTKADNYIASMFGTKDKSIKNEEIDAARKTYIEQNTIDLIEGYNCKEIMDALESEIDSFTKEVDSKIAVSNALTTIEISY